MSFLFHRAYDPFPGNTFNQPQEEACSKLCPRQNMQYLSKIPSQGRLSNYQGQMSKLFIGKAITHTLRSWQNSSPGKIFSCIGWKAKLFPRVEFPFFAEARGLMIFSQVTISICWSVIRNKQAAEICHKEHNCSIEARRSSRSQNPDPSPIKNLELTPSKNRGEECLMGHFPPNSSSSLSS